jgi:hypothetical protein
MIDLSTIPNFRPSEFSEDIQKYADPHMLRTLQRTRNLVGKSMYPSPVEGALARFNSKDKSSQHYAVDRKSTAVDCFVDEIPVKVFSLVWGDPEGFTGVGIYFNGMYRGKPQVRYHFDTRKIEERGYQKQQKLVWFVDEKGNICYPQTSTKNLMTFYNLLSQRRMF